MVGFYSQEPALLGTCPPGKWTATLEVPLSRGLHKVMLVSLSLKDEVQRRKYK